MINYCYSNQGHRQNFTGQTSDISQKYVKVTSLTIALSFHVPNKLKDQNKTRARIHYGKLTACINFPEDVNYSRTFLSLGILTTDFF